MKLELCSYDCPPKDPIENWIPDNDNDFFYELTLSIGVKGSQGCDLFYVNVISQNLKHKYEYQSQSIAVLPPYSFEKVLIEIKKIIESIDGATWQVCVNQLLEHFRWEFENYKQ